MRFIPELPVSRLRGTELAWQRATSPQRCHEAVYDGRAFRSASNSTRAAQLRRSAASR